MTPKTGLPDALPFLRASLSPPRPSAWAAKDAYVTQQLVSESPSCLTDLRNVVKYQREVSPCFRCLRPLCGPPALPVDLLCPIFGTLVDALRGVEPPATQDCLDAAELLTSMPEFFETEKMREEVFLAFLRRYLGGRFIVRRQFKTPGGYLADLAVFYVADGREHLVEIVEIKNELSECFFQGMRLYQVGGARSAVKHVLSCSPRGTRGHTAGPWRSFATIPLFAFAHTRVDLTSMLAAQCMMCVTFSTSHWHLVPWPA